MAIEVLRAWRTESARTVEVKITRLFSEPVVEVYSNTTGVKPHEAMNRWRRQDLRLAYCWFDLNGKGIHQKYFWRNYSHQLDEAWSVWEGQGKVEER